MSEIPERRDISISVALYLSNGVVKTILARGKKNEKKTLNKEEALERK